MSGLYSSHCFRLDCEREFLYDGQHENTKRASPKYMRHSSPNRPSYDYHYFWFFFHNVVGRPKKYRTRSFRYFEKICRVNITQNYKKKWDWQVGRYLFGWNFRSKFCEKNQFFWAMSESGRSFGLKIKKKKNKKKQKKKNKTIEYGSS